MKSKDFYTANDLIQAMSGKIRLKCLVIMRFPRFHGIIEL